VERIKEQSDSKRHNETRRRSVTKAEAIAADAPIPKIRFIKKNGVMQEPSDELTVGSSSDKLTGS
jgi:hypothetical protein